MDITVQSARENFIYFTLIAAGIGLLLGLIPLVIALRKGKVGLGLLADIVCTLMGAASPILALLSAAIFTWLALRKSSTEKNETASPSPDPTGLE